MSNLVYPGPSDMTQEDMEYVDSLTPEKFWALMVHAGVTENEV